MDFGGPTADELDAAAAWVRAQDASPEFPPILDTVVRHVRKDAGLE